jgi:lipopolysaccharide biosynthesis protein
MSNHGRDILPFLKILPRVFNDGHQVVLKLHTKGSNHLNRSELWRHDLFQKLIGSGKIDRAMAIFDSNPGIGMIGPAENILPMHNYYGSNANMINTLSQQMGLELKYLTDLNFVAGSMFYARKESLLPILNLNLSDQLFAPEAGQTDGTLAHAIERLFAVGLIATDLQLADTAYHEENPVLMVSKNHYFSI